MSLTILGVDDDVVIHERLYKARLTDPANGWTQATWRYHAAYTPPEAIDIMKREVIDIILLDNTITREGEGLDFLRDVRNNRIGLPHYVTIPIIMISADVVHEVAYSLGATCYMDKYSLIDSQEYYSLLVDILQKYDQDRNINDLILRK